MLPRAPRPVLLAPLHVIPSDRALIAFDGSYPASRALHMFALLGLASDRDLQVLTVAGRQSEASVLAQAGVTLLRAHGAKSADAVSIVSASDPAEVIINHAQSTGAGLVVTGSYGHSGLKDLLFGSCTRRLLQSCSSALFVHH